MTAQDIYSRFRAWPILWQLAAGVAVLLVVLWLAGALQGAVTAFNDWRFDRRAEQAETERDSLRVERDAALKRAEAAEAQAAVYEEEAEAQKRLAADAAISAREKARRAEEIGHEADRIASGAGDLAPDDARQYIREAIERLNRR